MFKVQVSCDCPGCQKTTTVVNRNDELPKPWDALGVLDTEYHGCCSFHLSVAVLMAIGFSDIARLMLENINAPEHDTPETAP